MGTGSRQYRQWAAEARRKAEAVKDEPTLRQSYLDLAAAYGKLADTLERPFMETRADPSKGRCDPVAEDLGAHRHPANLATRRSLALCQATKNPARFPKRGY
jgi:hypothetical protein